MSCSSRFLAKTSNKMQFAFWIELFEIQWNRAGSIGGSVGSNIPFLKMKLGLRGSSVCIMKPWLWNVPSIQVLTKEVAKFQAKPILLYSRQLPILGTKLNPYFVITLISTLEIMAAQNQQKWAKLTNVLSYNKWYKPK